MAASFKLTAPISKPMLMLMGFPGFVVGQQ